VRLRLLPAPPDSGLVFRRVDLQPAVDIPARAGFVVCTSLATTLGYAGQEVATVEHLLAALAGLGVDNAVLEVDACEVPILDGSAAPFVALLRRAGLRDQVAPRRFLRVLREVSIEDGDKSASFLPFAGCRVAFTIDFEQPVFSGASPHLSVDLTRDSFADEVSAARTFGFIDEVEALRARGLVLGGSFDNAVVLTDDRVLNREGLRFEDEFVRHKLLDAVGDLALLGAPLLGEFRAVKSGHTLNNAAVRALLAARDAWELVTLPEPTAAVAAAAL
jgi:UDP-3-O-[3-hydroxymyristoyl] N-acetylglucosamine deacetylase